MIKIKTKVCIILKFFTTLLKKIKSINSIYIKKFAVEYVKYIY